MEPTNQPSNHPWNCWVLECLALPCTNALINEDLGELHQMSPSLGRKIASKVAMNLRNEIGTQVDCKKKRPAQHQNQKTNQEYCRIFADLFLFLPWMNCWNRLRSDQPEKPNLPTLDRPSTQTYRSYANLQAESSGERWNEFNLTGFACYFQLLDWWDIWPLWGEEGCCSNTKECYRNSSISLLFYTLKVRHDRYESQNKLTRTFVFTLGRHLTSRNILNC